jgi:hypothetical protein
LEKRDPLEGGMMRPQDFHPPYSGLPDRWMLDPETMPTGGADRRATGMVRNIWFNDPAIEGVRPLKGHDNHFHVDVRSPCIKR